MMSSIQLHTNMRLLKSALRSTAAARQYRRTVAAMPRSVAQHQVASARLLATTANGGFGSAAALACGLSLCTAAAYGVNSRRAECEIMLSPVAEPATGILFPKLCNGLCL